VKINPLFLGLAAGVLFFLTRRTDAGESVGHGETAGGKPPKKGRTWDLANWSTTSTGAVIPPPGLPPSARRPSAAGDALPAVRAAAAKYGVPGFPEAMEALAINESGGRYALPAWTYNTLPKAKRPAGKSFISAWGLYQWQNAHALKNFGVDKAWKMTPDQEVSGSIARYAEILAGANNDPAGVFLWHISPVAYSYAKKQMKKGIPTRQAIRQGAASRGKKWEGVLQGYLKKWAKLYPAALEPVVAEQLYSGAFPSDFG
jgi:hypothetical protein